MATQMNDNAEATVETPEARPGGLPPREDVEAAYQRRLEGREGKTPDKPAPAPAPEPEAAPDEDPDFPAEAEAKAARDLEIDRLIAAEDERRVGETEGRPGGLPSREAVEAAYQRRLIEQGRGAPVDGPSTPAERLEAARRRGDERGVVRSLNSDEERARRGLPDAVKIQEAAEKRQAERERQQERAVRARRAGLL